MTTASILLAATLLQPVAEFGPADVGVLMATTNQPAVYSSACINFAGNYILFNFETCTFRGLAKVSMSNEDGVATMTIADAVVRSSPSAAAAIALDAEEIDTEKELRGLDWPDATLDRIAPRPEDYLY